MNALYSESSEVAVLGALMTSPELVPTVDRLRPEMFYLDSHRKVYNAILDVAETSATFDFVMIQQQLRRTKELDAIGGIGYLMKLTEGIPHGFVPDHHVGQVIEAWHRRRGVALCEEKLKAFKLSDIPAGQSFAQLQSEALDAMNEGRVQEDPHVRFHTVPVLDRLFSEDAPGEPYGLAGLDSQTGGYRMTHNTTVGAWPGTGKSGFLCQVVATRCRQGDGADVFSKEMSREDVLLRLYAIESGVPYANLYHRRLSPVQREYVRQAAYRVAEWNLRIHEKRGQTLAQMIAQMRLSARRDDSKLCAVDYAQIVPVDGVWEAKDRVGKVSNDLTELAKDEGLHLLLLSQLSKQGQTDREPMLSDLRETGALEDNAHVVLLLHRPWERSPEGNIGGKSNNGIVIIPKNRNGPTGTIAATFNPNTLTFE